MPQQEPTPRPAVTGREPLTPAVAGRQTYEYVLVDQNGNPITDQTGPITFETIVEAASVKRRDFNNDPKIMIQRRIKSA